jgi:hypothetical protein
MAHVPYSEGPIALPCASHNFFTSLVSIVQMKLPAVRKLMTEVRQYTYDIGKQTHLQISLLDNLSQKINFVVIKFFTFAY